jgi:hypothetical protein
MIWNRHFNLISGGPSRIHLAKEDLIPDSPVVTINRALDVVERGIQVDFAMFADGPDAMVNQLGLGKYIKPPLQVWVPRSAIFPDNGVLNHYDMPSMWEPFLPMSVGLRVTPFGFVGGLDGRMRHQFAALAALERMMMFRPSTIRVLCADMIGGWVPGRSEEECEVIQSNLEQNKKNLGLAQRRVNESKGNDKTAVIVRDNLQKVVDELEKSGDWGKFRRWEHERHALKEFTKRAEVNGCKVEFKAPGKVVTA